jgi:hypothetical protein
VVSVPYTGMSLLAWRIGLLKGSVRRTVWTSLICDSLTVCRPRRWRSMIGIWCRRLGGADAGVGVTLWVAHRRRAALSTVPSPNAAVKVAAIVAGMVAGADPIWTGCAWRDGPAVWRDRGTAEHLPPRIQLWPRRQPDKVAAGLSVSLAGHTPLLRDADRLTFVDIDYTVKRSTVAPSRAPASRSLLAVQRGQSGSQDTCRRHIGSRSRSGFNVTEAVITLFSLRSVTVSVVV